MLSIFILNLYSGNNFSISYFYQLPQWPVQTTKYGYPGKSFVISQLLNYFHHIYLTQILDKMSSIRLQGLSYMHKSNYIALIILTSMLIDVLILISYVYMVSNLFKCDYVLCQWGDLVSTLFTPKLSTSMFSKHFQTVLFILKINANICEHSIFIDNYICCNHY